MAKKELSKGKQPKKELCWECPNIAERAPEQREEAHEFAKGYMEFLGVCKTERECVSYTEKLLLETGYERFDSKKKYKTDDKVFSTSRGRAMAVTVFGKKSIVEGARINGTHIDSPCIDLRPNSLYGSNDIALLRTHYYGGTKKCQWGTIPLTMHGVIVKGDDTTVGITVGEDPSDPVLYVTDLLIHLTKQQVQRTLSEGLRAGELSIALGTTPYPNDNVKGPFCLEVLHYLNEKYGITGRGFAQAEIGFVPAGKPCDISFDRSLIDGYSQDGRARTYAVLRAQLDTVNPEYTTITILTDKEEIGSCGTTGSKSNFLYDYICYLAQMGGVNAKDVFAKPVCLPADVNGACDPTSVDAFKAKNSSYLDRGVVLAKYTGSNGKFGTSDVSAKFMAKVINIMDRSGICWQIGELGKLDLGGGGTIAGDVACLNVDIVDLGVAILSVHSPFEVTSKLDNYNIYLAFKTLYPET